MRTTIITPVVVFCLLWPLQTLAGVTWSYMENSFVKLYYDRTLGGAVGGLTLSF